MEPTTVTCTNACTITLQISPMPATQEQYDAVNAIFAALLGAMCLIWGAKAVYRLFHKPTDA